MTISDVILDVDGDGINSIDVDYIDAAGLNDPAIPWCTPAQLAKAAMCAFASCLNISQPRSYPTWDEVVNIVRCPTDLATQQSPTMKRVLDSRQTEGSLLNTEGTQLFGARPSVSEVRRKYSKIEIYQLRTMRKVLAHFRLRAAASRRSCYSIEDRLNAVLRWQLSRC